MLKFLTGAAMAALMSLSAPSLATAGAPLEAYGSLPAIESVGISPDGTALAMIVTVNDERRIIVRALTGEVRASAIIGHSKVRNVAWADSNHVVIEVSSTTAIEDTTYVGEHWQAVALNVQTGKLQQLPIRAADTLLNIIQGRIQPGEPNKGKSIVYTPLYVTEKGNMQHKGGHLDLFEIDLDSGIAHRQQMGDYQTEDYLVKSNGTVLAKASYENNEHTNDATWTLSLRRGISWQEVAKTTDARNTPSMWGVSPDGQSVVIDTWDKENELWRPTSIALSDGKVGDFIGPPRKQGALIDADGTVLAFTHRDEFVEFDFIEPRLKALWPAYRNAFKGQQVSLESWTPDYKKLILFVTSSNSSGGYYIADTTTKRVDPIGSPYPKVVAADVANVRMIEYAAADGLPIKAILTTPKGRPETNLPLVVLPHGGPQYADYITFDWWAQAIASRGYAVLQPNFRGSTNIDHAFMEAGNGEWGGKMQTDLSDGVSFLAKAGVVDPKRVCIFGGSYGGYAALAGVALQKGVYRCAVSLAGPSDLAGRLRDEITKYGENNGIIRYRKRVYGVQSASDPKLKAISPASHADNVEVPVLLIHGKDDTVVPFSESQKMASALKDAKKPYEFVVLDGEDHWLSNGATRKQMLNAAMTFIEKNNPPN